MNHSLNKLPMLSMYEADTWHDATGRIIFADSKGQVCAGFHHKTKRTDGPCLIRHLNSLEEDYATVWAKFERRIREIQSA